MGIVSLQDAFIKHKNKFHSHTRIKYALDEISIFSFHLKKNG
ncbi:hypothetical protein HNR74_003460 [Flammeovirga kamogawensis]|nr:hypothetical protein [Flammeovirga kamogawensis]